MNPSTPSVNASDTPPQFVATTGTPHAIASSTTVGSPSSRLGSRHTCDA